MEYPNWMSFGQRIFCTAPFVILPFLVFWLYVERKKLQAKQKAMKMAQSGHRWIHDS